MKAELVELKIESLSAVVPKLQVLPAAEVLPLLSGSSDIMDRFAYTAGLLRKYISVELVEQYESLDLEDMIEFVSQWLQKSTPKNGEEN